MCIHGSTNGNNGLPISFKDLPMVPLVISLVPMAPLVKTDDSQYYRQYTVWAKLPMVPLATNGTIGKISNGTIGRIPNARNEYGSGSFRSMTFSAHDHLGT